MKGCECKYDNVQNRPLTATNFLTLRGEIQRTVGARTYPAGYKYDAQGRLTHMTNWSSYSGFVGARVTQWNYNANRGWLDNKRYPDATTGAPSSIGTDYTYTPAGRLATRVWARGNPRLATTYGYNYAGDLEMVDYSDSTPDLSYGHDWLGRIIRVTQAGSYTSEFNYNLAGQVLKESFNGLWVTNLFDARLRHRAVGLQGQSSTTVSYGYDGASRLQYVTNGIHLATYTYVANSPLVQHITFKQNTTVRMMTTRAWDKLNRLQSISSAAQKTVSSDYGYNGANQRTRNTQADSSYWVYEYDSLGQVTSGKKYWSDGTPVAGQQFDYGFDQIGNRASTKAGGDENGANLRSATYSANRLNQYTQRTVPGDVDVIGAAHAGATVTVNSQSTYRRGEYFRKELSVANSTTNEYPTITTSATWGTTNENVVGKAFVPQTPEIFLYDLDGNLTNDGRWVFNWDAENRVTQMISSNVVDAARKKLNFEYDFQGRRVRKTVHDPNGQNWTVIQDHRSVYNGWNLIAELNATNNAVIRSYVWGNDLSGTKQGAGGVGGLLGINDAANGFHFPAYDGNGNVAALVSATDGNVSATYDYGPFGELIHATGAMAKLNPIRFSTKYTADESDFLYYGHRYYNANAGRWLSRDPLTDESVLRPYTRRLHRSSARRALEASLGPAYAFLGNRPIIQVDKNGLFGYYLEGIEEAMFLLYGPDLITPLDWPVQIFPGEGKALNISVGRCSIAIITHHGASDPPHKFDFAPAGDCGVTSFGGTATCDSPDLNRRIPAPNLIPGSPMHEGDILHNSEEGIQGRKDIRTGALAQAAELCKRDCCGRVAIVTYEAPKGEALEDFFYHDNDPKLEYYDCKTRRLK